MNERLRHEPDDKCSLWLAADVGLQGRDDVAGHNRADNGPDGAGLEAGRRGTGVVCIRGLARHSASAVRHQQYHGLDCHRDR